MGNNPKDIRRSPRHKLEVDLTSYLFKAEDRSPIRCVGTDVSKEGLGLVSFDELILDSKVIFRLKDIGIILKVVWSRNDSVRDGIHHVGLMTTNPKYDLVKICKEIGMLKE